LGPLDRRGCAVHWLLQPLGLLADRRSLRAVHRACGYGAARVANGAGGYPMKVLVLTGPEATGKSRLAERLLRTFGGVLVGEYVRDYIEQTQRDTTFADIPAISRGQLVGEDAARIQAPHLLILDTHLLSNMFWSHTLFGDCPAWLED